MTALYEMHKNISNQIGDKIIKFCSPLQNFLGVSHFYHYMLTDSGHFASEGLNQDWHERLFSGPEGYLALPYFRHSKKTQSRVMFTQAVEDGHWKQLSQLASNDFNVNLGLQLTIQTDEGMEAFGFGLKTSDPLQHMALLNELPLLNVFLREYRKEFSTKVLRDNFVDVAALIGPSFYEAPQTPELDLHDEFLGSMDLEVPNLFTKRETEVINLLLQGYSAAKIGDKLYLSKRTIEHRIEDIKSKLDCATKPDLIQKIRELESFGYFI